MAALRLEPEVEPELSAITGSPIPVPPNDTFPSSLNRIVDVVHRALSKRPHLDLTNLVKVNPSAHRQYCGGYGDVYEGIYTHRKTGERIRVAVKRIRIDGDLTKALKSIAREMRIWSELDHPNIMPLVGYVVEGSYPSFVSRWMDRGSLHACLPYLNRVEAISMIRDIASGLAYMHERGAIHSDLKSDNILVTPDGQARLTDFGASRMDTLSSGYSTRTNAGSLRWLAKELLPEEEDEIPQFTCETDVWAFGMTVYEILARQRPYARTNMDSVIVLKIIRGRLPEKPTFSKGHVDAILEDFMWSLCEDCWKTVPGERPTMHDLEDLIRIFKELELRT